MRTLENTIREVVLNEAKLTRTQAVMVSDNHNVHDHMFTVAHKIAKKAEETNSFQSKAIHYKDAADYLKIAHHLASAEPHHAQSVWRHLDTAARDYAFDLSPKHVHKHIADVLNTELLK